MTFWKGKLIDAIKISDSLWLGGRKWMDWAQVKL
jgi:hypothetical protein